MSALRWDARWGAWGLTLNLRSWDLGIDRIFYDGPIFILSIGPLHLSRAGQNRKPSPSTPKEK